VNGGCLHGLDKPLEVVARSPARFWWSVKKKRSFGVVAAPLCLGSFSSIQSIAGQATCISCTFCAKVQDWRGEFDLTYRERLFQSIGGAVYKDIQFIIALLSGLFWCIFAASSFCEPLKLNSAAFESVEAQYFFLDGRELSLHEDFKGPGGAIYIQGRDIVYAAANGDFLLIQPDGLIYERNYLPHIEMGRDLIEKSKRITYKELLPRIHDIIFANGAFYITHDTYDANADGVRFVVSTIRKGESAWRDIYSTPPLDIPYYALGNGGRMAFNSVTNKIYLSIGDYSLDRINHLPSDVAPQNPNLPWGKIAAIDLKSQKLQFVSVGHRNPQGLAFLGNGDLISSEHGPKGGDELNIIEPGKNYGWPYESFGTHYGQFKEYKEDLPPSKVTKFQPPIFSWVPSIAPTQLQQMQDFDPRWNGDVLMGSLRAMSLFHIKMDGRHVLLVEQLNINRRVRDLAQSGPNIYVLTDDATIVVLKRRP